jgi:hypothetical protein
MAVALCRTNEYQDLLYNSLKTHTRIGITPKDTIVGMEQYIPDFKVANIKWKRVDKDTAFKINSCCNLKPIYDNSYGWFYFIIALIGIGIMLFAAVNSSIKACFTNVGFLFLFVGACIMALMSLDGVTNVVKHRLKRNIAKGEYEIVDITPIAAFKGVEHSRYSSWDYVTILFEVGDYVFEDDSLAYLHSVPNYDCEHKLDYDSYKLIKIKTHNLYNIPITCYAICCL